MATGFLSLLSFMRSRGRGKGLCLGLLKASPRQLMARQVLHEIDTIRVCLPPQRKMCKDGQLNVRHDSIKIKRVGHGWAVSNSTSNLRTECSRNVLGVALSSESNVLGVALSTGHLKDVRLGLVRVLCLQALLGLTDAGPIHTTHVFCLLPWQKVTWGRASKGMHDFLVICPQNNLKLVGLK